MSAYRRIRFISLRGHISHAKYELDVIFPVLLGLHLHFTGKLLDN
jgi:hypothetical protein